MPLSSTLGTNANDIIRRRFFGKFDSLMYAQGLNSQFQKQTEDIKTLNLDDFYFEDKLNAHAQKQGGGLKDYVILAHDPSVLYVFIPNFTQTRELDVLIDTWPFLLVDLRETIEDAAPFLVGMNGSLVIREYLSFYLSGYVYQNNNQVLTSDTRPTQATSGAEMMSFQYYEDQGQNYFDFKYGKDPSKGDGLGGLNPIVYNGKPIISPDESNKDGIINKTYHGLTKQAKNIGRHVLAYRSDHQQSSVLDDSVLIFFVKNGVDPGLKISAIRNHIDWLDFDNAVGLDGSDSVLLYEGSNRMLIGNDIWKKNRVCKTGYCIR